MKQTIHIQNLKCGGCKASILQRLKQIEDLKEVNINVEQNTVDVEFLKANTLLEIKGELIKMGYPPVDEENSTVLKAKSYVHCMIGKTNNALSREKV